MKDFKRLQVKDFSCSSNSAGGGGLFFFILKHENVKLRAQINNSDLAT